MATTDLPRHAYLSDLTHDDYLSSGVTSNAAFFLESEQQLQWRKIESQLDRWWTSPGTEDEDGYISPSAKSIVKVSRLLNSMIEYSVFITPRVIENGDGGIVVKFDLKNSRKTVFEIDEDGQIELRNYQNNRVVEQRQI